MASIVFPFALSLYVKNPSILARYQSKKEIFDGLFNANLGYGVVFFAASFNRGYCYCPIFYGAR